MIKKDTNVMYVKLIWSGDHSPQCSQRMLYFMAALIQENSQYKNAMQICILLKIVISSILANKGVKNQLQ